MAGVPMWIPHGFVALGFALILLIAALAPCHRHDAARGRAFRARGRQGAGMTFALFVVPVVLLLIGFPIFMVLLTAVTVALVFFMHVPLMVVHQNLFGSVNATPLLAVPFFIYAGELMGRGSVAQRLVDFVQSGVGSVRGSLGVTAVGTSAIFGAISGASAATVATIGKVMVPAMRRAGYPETFTAGLITAVGAIDVIIPPSIPMIVYGAAAEDSVARLYAAGVIPGLMIAAHDRGLCHVAGQAGEFRRRRTLRPQAFPPCGGPQYLGARRTGHHPGRHLWWSIFADRSRRGGLRLCGPRHRLCVSGAGLARYRRSRRIDRTLHGTDPDHCRLRRRVCLVADGESGAGDSYRLAPGSKRIGMDAPARHQRSAARRSAASSIRCRRSCCSAHCSCPW